MNRSRRALTVQNVRIRHEERESWTPDGVSFEVSPGEVVLILGPSGSGKSTLALSLNGLIPHSIAAEMEGTVTAGGLNVREATVAQISEKVAMVFQNPDAQIVTGTVLDEVCFGPENLRLDTSEILSRAERALKQVGLWERRDENPDRLSLGGRQRLAIAAALALGSQLLVLDEPTANLDPAGIDEVYEVLRQLVQSRERHAIVLIEHNLDAAIDLVDRVVVINASGQQVLAGPVRETLLENVDMLLQMGVWLPVSTLAALRLRTSGAPIEPLSLTTAELTYAIDALPELPPLPSSVPLVSSSSAATSTAPQAPSLATPQAPSLPASLESETSEIQARDEPLIEVRNLTVRRGRTTILKNIDVSIGGGDFVAVVGTNGAGKTTLVQAIAGVVAPPRGHVRVGRLDPGHAPVRALSAEIGFVFQNPEHQFITDSVYNELSHGLRIRQADEQITDDELEARVEEILLRIGLCGMREVHPFLLSGGQKRRLSVGTALITGAPILALDEPTFGQDRERAAELLGLLADLNRAGTTVLAVTHDMQLVADYSSHVLVLADGELVAYGPTPEVLADAEQFERAGLRLPPLARALRGLKNHPAWRGITRLQDLPGAPG